MRIPTIVAKYQVSSVPKFDFGFSFITDQQEDLHIIDASRTIGRSWYISHWKQGFSRALTHIQSSQSNAKILQTCLGNVVDQFSTACLS